MQSTQVHTSVPARKRGYLIRLGLVFVVALIAGGFGAAGCLNRPLCSVKADSKGNLTEDCRPRTTNLFVDTITNRSVDKIDLLFMIDNSSSMADKQVVLSQAVPDLVNRLVSPICVNQDGTRSNVQAPADPAVDCPAPTTREFKPITDIHIGIVTSSIGSHGAPGDSGQPHLCEAGLPPVPDGNDHAELLGSLPRGQSSVFPAGTPGFLDWNPKTHAGEDVNQFNTAFGNMVRAAGQSGCGLEAQFEAVYRFLVDPAPPQNIVLSGNPPRATPQGIDNNILNQRKAFLRADSLVAVIFLTDENDCSIRDTDQYYYAASLGGVLPKASSACGTNPNDPCCYSCGLQKPANCGQADPACGPPVPSLTPTEDSQNLRCFDEKRRFGIDFLYPVKRYVNALTQPTICSTSVDLTPDPANCPQTAGKTPGLVANPLFQDLSNQGGSPRDPSLVFVAGITGVPWQLIAEDKTSPELHYKTYQELTDQNLWSQIMSDPTPAGGGPPTLATDPHMVESVDPRPGLPGPNTPATSDEINGHEWVITKRDDLQYACIFDKPPGGAACDTIDCDCFSRQPGDNNPLCWDGTQYVTNNQLKAKAYPCLREMQLLHDFGKNSIVASLCARNLRDPNAQDYGYRPAVDAIIDRLKEALTLKCLPRKLEVAADGTVPCSIIEATTNPADAACDPAKNRVKPDPKLIDPARQRLAADKACDNDPSTAIPDCGKYQFCEICSTAASAATGKCVPTGQKDTCLDPTPAQTAIGWCYVEPDHVPPLGDPSLVAKCQSNQRQILRFVGDNTPVRGGTVLIACLGAPVGGTASTAPPTMTTLPDGAPGP